MVTRRGLMGVIGSVTMIGSASLFNQALKLEQKETITSNYIREIVHDDEKLILMYEYFPVPKLKENDNGYFSTYDNENEVVIDIDYDERTLSIDKEVYAKMKSTGIERTSIGFDKFYRELQQKRSDKLKEIVNTLITDREDSELIHAYYVTKQIIYREDFKSETSKQIDYIRYPTETIIDSEGDCKDKTALFIGIAAELGYDVGYAWYPSHVTPLIRTKDINSEFYTQTNTITVNKKQYVPVEVTENIDFQDAIKNTENIIIGRSDEFKYTINNYKGTVTHIKEMINTYTNINTN